MSSKMTRTEIVANIAASQEVSKAAVNRVLDGLIDIITQNLESGIKTSIPGFITIERTETKGRTGRNPQTGEEILIPAGTKTKITAGTKIAEAGKGKK